MVEYSHLKKLLVIGERKLRNIAVQGASPIYIGACTLHRLCSKNVAKRGSIKHLPDSSYFTTFVPKKRANDGVHLVFTEVVKTSSIASYNFATVMRLSFMNI